MAKDAIADARAQRDAADRTLAQHNLDWVERARAALASMQPQLADLNRIAGELDPCQARDNIGHLLNVANSVDMSLDHEAQVHSRTLARLAADQA